MKDLTTFPEKTDPEYSLIYSAAGDHVNPLYHRALIRKYKCRLVLAFKGLFPLYVTDDKCFCADKPLFFYMYLALCQNFFQKQ